ncbi:MAG: flagellar hook-length control protein FliK [Nitrospirae bacterium]|nr:flagellar hook-length control protein FliK [Nitrospirota bacterium]
MVDNMMVPVTANSPASVLPAGGVTGGVGQDSSQTANFTDILQTVISNLDHGFGNIQGGTVVNADGKTISLDDLIQQLLNGGSDNTTESGKKTDSGINMDNALLQMIIQLQASISQPAVTVPSGQANSSGVDLTALSGNLTSNTADPALNAINAAMLSVGAELVSMAQQNQTNNVANQMSDNMNSAVSGTEGAALTGSALNAAIQNSIKSAQDAVNAATPNTGDAMLNAVISAQNTVNPAMLNDGSLTQNAVNSAMLNDGGLTQNVVNAAMQNTGSSMQNAVSAFALSAASSTQNAVNLNDGSLTQNAVNAAMQNTGSSMQNAVSAFALSAASSTQNAVNAATLNAENLAQNAVTYTTQNAGSQTLNDSITGDLSIKELRITTVNESKSASEDAAANTGLSTVPLHQTVYTQDSKPVQETLPVSRLNELSEPILKTLGSGDSNLVIKLSPPDMGTIQIRLKMENGVLTADFKVDSSAVKDLFTSAMPQIRQSIESSGIKTGNFFTDLKEDSFTEGRRQQDQNQNQQQQRQSKEQKSQFFDFFA